MMNISKDDFSTSVTTKLTAAAAAAAAILVQRRYFVSLFTCVTVLTGEQN